MVWLEILDHLKPAFDLLLTVATIVLAAVTVFLWLATRKLAVDARLASDQQGFRTETALKTADRSASAAEITAITAEKTARLQLRAYVAPEFARIVPLEDAPTLFFLHIQIKNFGQTPATEAGWEKIVTYSESPEGWLRQEDRPKRAPVLAPGQTYSTRVNCQASATITAAIKHSRANLHYIVATLSYRDAYEEDFQRTFYFSFDPRFDLADNLMTLSELPAGIAPGRLYSEVFRFDGANLDPCRPLWGR